MNTETNTRCHLAKDIHVPNILYPSSWLILTEAFPRNIVKNLKKSVLASLQTRFVTLVQHFWHQQHLRKEVDLFFTATLCREEFLSNRLFLSTTHMQGTLEQLFMQMIASLQTQLFNSHVCM
jgi:hypothetical protein